MRAKIGRKSGLGLDVGIFAAVFSNVTNVSRISLSVSVISKSTLKAFEEKSIAKKLFVT